MTRDETDEERADRKFTDLLQDLRVMQTGVQLTAGFLLTLPFQARFPDLGRSQHVTYLALVVLAGLTTLLVLVIGITFFVFDVVVDRVAALVTAGAMTTLALVLLLLIPGRLVPGE